MGELFPRDLSGTNIMCRERPPRSRGVTVCCVSLAGREKELRRAGRGGPCVAERCRYQVAHSLSVLRVSHCDLCVCRTLCGVCRCVVCAPASPAVPRCGAGVRARAVSEIDKRERSVASLRLPHRHNSRARRRGFRPAAYCRFLPSFLRHHRKQHRSVVLCRASS